MLEDHPLAQLFPTMNEKDFQELKADIAEAGEVFIPIELYEGKILDGRHRYRCCCELGLNCPMREYTGTEPLKRIMSLNERRRHLSESQRAIVAAKVANMRQGERTDVEPSVNLPKVSQEEAAQQLGVSVKSVGDAKVVLESGDDQLIADVEAGKSSVSRAATDVRKQKFIERWGTPEEKEALSLGDQSIENIWGACKERQRLDVWLRTQRGETQREIASALGISQSLVSKIVQEAKDIYGETAEDKEDEDLPEDKNTYVEGLPYPVTATEAEEILLDQAAEDLETQHDEDDSLPKTSPIEVLVIPQPEPPLEEFTYSEPNLDGYKRWLDVFAKHIALIGGLDDIGGMNALLRPLSHDRREHILQNMISMRDSWNKHIDDAVSMMSNDLIPVGRTIFNGQ